MVHSMKCLQGFANIRNGSFAKKELRKKIVLVQSIKVIDFLRLPKNKEQLLTKAVPEYFLCEPFLELVGSGPFLCLSIVSKQINQKKGFHHYRCVRLLLANIY